MAVGQVPNEKDAESDAIFFKIRKIDLLFNLLPVLYTKDQINQLLPAIEASRSEIRKIRDTENTEYRSVEKECDKAISDAQESQILPPRSVRSDLSSLLSAMQGRDLVVRLQNIDRVKAVFDRVMTKAQKKVAANSLEPRQIDIKTKIEDLTQDDKEIIYVREILLDRFAYDLLVEMAKHMK